MKNFIVKAVAFVLFTTIALFFIITEVIPPQFNDTYQSAINGKYRRLVETQSPKVIFIAGSSGAFGINEEIISRRINMPVVNLSLHAGMGIKFGFELSKANIEKDDIVILGCEYDQWMRDPYFGSDLIVTGIDNNIKLYRYIPTENIIDVIKYFPKFSLKKTDSFLFTKEVNSGSYQSSSFKNGNMIYDRPKCVLPNPIPKEKYVKVTLDKNSNISPKTVQSVNEFSEYVSNKGAKLLITFPPLLNEVLKSSISDTNEFEKCLSEKLDSPIISNINDYVFTREYMYDTIYHCNNQGEKQRSELLAEDIVQYLYN